VSRTIQDGRTPLHWAAAGENLAIVQLLLTHEPEIDAKDQGGPL
jgi:ankyrin repeat protein